MPSTPRLRHAAFFALIAASAVAMALVYQRFGRASGDPLTFAYKGDTYELSTPQTVAIGLSLPLLLWALGRSLADLPWPQRVMALTLRFAFLGLLAVALARLSRTTTTSKVCTVYVIDVSESIPAEALVDAREELSRGLAARGKDDVVKLITFARRPRVVDLLDDGARAPDLARHDAEGQRGKLGS
ncbi:MAG: VWA domain-containing protein, partial [Polyangiaceae bacterium]|nr:VWA domain-containing protein [Polyangiaceae bacterium]